MKKLCLTLLMCVTLQGFCPNSYFKVTKIQQYSDNEITMFAIIDYESKWGKHTINHKENAIGHLQIRPMVIKDVNTFFNKNYTLQDRFDFDKSVEIFWLYHKAWKSSTPEQIARNWNGGPNGKYKTATLSYWREIQKRIKKYEHLKYKHEVTRV